MESLWRNDLPERLDPMTAKELHQSLRRGSFVSVFLLVQLLAILATAAEFFALGATSSGADAAVLNPSLLWNSGPFWGVTAGICAVLLPLSGLWLMDQELDEANHELLLLTKLSRWRVVAGKFITLWGLCALTFLSLLPYVVARYTLGGKEWTYELCCALTVLGISAMLCAGSIGASAFRGIGSRIVVFALFFFSMFVSAGIPLLASAAITRTYGWIYHLNAFLAVVATVVIGLALARSKMRLVLHAYEVNPSGMIIALLFFAPFLAAMATGVTLARGGGIGLGVMALFAALSDVTIKAPKWLPPPPPNIPPLPPPAEAKSS